MDTKTKPYKPYTHYSNWEPIVAHAWIAISEESYATAYLKSGGVRNSKDVFVLENYLTFHTTAELALAEAKQQSNVEMLLCKVGFSELTCINGLQCAVHGDTMDFPVTVIEKLTIS